MPNIKSAKKRIKVTKGKTMRNKALKSDLKTVLKKAEIAIEQNGKDKEEVVLQAVKRVDELVSKGVCHKNKAARIKSQLMGKLNRLAG